MNKLPTYRIVINEEDETSGVDFISLVSEPAIEENWMAFSSVQFDFEAQKEKQMLFGPLMIPDKNIYRNDMERGEYNVFFTKDDIESVVKKFSKNNFNNNISFEHQGQKVKGTLVENFIVKEGMVVPGYESIPAGSWMGCVYIDDKDFWTTYVKSDILKGFSIEINGFLSRQEFNKNIDIWKVLETIVGQEISDDEMIEKITEQFKIFKFETYNDYPAAASENAKVALRWAEKNGWGDCGTAVGKVRANQLANGENISRETIARMAAFERHRQNSDRQLGDGCGRLMWLCWGGDAGIEWATKKLKSIDAALSSSSYQSLINMSTDPEMIECYSCGWIWKIEDSEVEEMYICHKCGCDNEIDSEELAVGPRGGIIPVKKAPKSKTPNKNPQGKGSSKGDASSSRGADVSAADEKTLKNKSDDFNERYKEKLGYGVNVGMLKSVFVRGLGAFATSHSPVVKSASQWAFARVNAFLYMVKNGRPQNKKYDTDFDLLPEGHPKKGSKKKEEKKDDKK